MAGLKNKLKQLTLQKSEITKIRRKGENEYKKVKSLSRKYSSSLKSTQKRIETFKQNIEDINEMISQKTAQMESVQRLKLAAQEKLNFEIQNKEQIENEIDFADTPEEKQGLEYRLNSIVSSIDEIKNEIKQRASMEKKFLQTVSEIEKKKNFVSKTIKKNIESKPEIMKLAKTTQQKLDSVSKKFESAKKRELSIIYQLSKIKSVIPKAKPKARKVKAKPKARKVKAKPKARKVKAKPKARKVKAKPKARKVKAKPKARKVKAKPKARKVKAKPKARKVKAKPKARKVKAKPKARKVKSKIKKKKSRR